MKKETELRYDLLTDDWVVVAPGRAKRFREKNPLGVCPFCEIESQREPALVYSNGVKKDSEDLKNWTTVVIPNKYPVCNPYQNPKKEKENEFRLKIKSPGFHELVITRDHSKPMALLPLGKIKEVFDCYKDRLTEYKKYDFVKQVVVFHNHGSDAAASQPHPHSQILTMPLIDKEFEIILNNSEKYFKKNKKCLQCEIINLEKKNKERIVFENKDFIAYCPFAPKFLFEVIITPKKHNPDFTEIKDSEKQSLAEAFKHILLKLYKKLDNPSYNFYLHTAPYGKKYPHFHYYWKIFPRLSPLAGFELGANMEILTMLPEDQAKFLRK